MLRWWLSYESAIIIEIKSGNGCSFGGFYFLKWRKMKRRRATHPWVYLWRELEARERSQKNFADIIGISAPALNAIIKGEKNLTPALCVRIWVAFGTSPEFWMKIQTRYNLEKAKIKEENRIEKVFEKVKKYWYELLTYEDEDYEVEEQEEKQSISKEKIHEPVCA